MSDTNKNFSLNGWPLAFCIVGCAVAFAYMVACVSANDSDRIRAQAERIKAIQSK